MQRGVVMEMHDDSPEMNYRGVLTYQSITPASDLEAMILSARFAGQPSPVIEIDITLGDGRTSTLTVEVLNETAMISDAGNSYRCHRLPYEDDEVNEVTLLIPSDPAGKKALVSLSY